MTINEQIQQVKATIIDVLKDIVGIYMFGSFVESELKPNSDLDFLVLVPQPLADNLKSTLIHRISPLSRNIGDNNHLRYVELTIVTQKDMAVLQYPPKQDFIYGEWLHDEYIKGYIPPSEFNSDLMIVLYQALQNNKQIYGMYSLHELLPDISFSDVKKAMMDSLDLLINHYEGDEANTILTLCRMILTMDTKQIIPKDVAGNSISKTIPLKHQKNVLLAVSNYEGQSVDWSCKDVKQTIDYLSTYLKNTGQ